MNSNSEGTVESRLHVVDVPVVPDTSLYEDIERYFKLSDNLEDLLWQFDAGLNITHADTLTAEALSELEVMMFMARFRAWLNDSIPKAILPSVRKVKYQARPFSPTMNVGPGEDVTYAEQLFHVDPIEEGNERFFIASDLTERVVAHTEIIEGEVKVPFCYDPKNKDHDYPADFVGYRALEAGAELKTAPNDRWIRMTRETWHRQGFVSPGPIAYRHMVIVEYRADEPTQ